MIQWILQGCVEPNVHLKEEGNLIHMSVKTQSPLVVDAVLNLLKRCNDGIFLKEKLEDTDAEGLTPFLVNCKHGSLPIAELLSDAGADINAIGENDRYFQATMFTSTLFTRFFFS